jgi:hypothetical protein
MKRNTVRRFPVAVLGAAFAVFVTILSFVFDRTRSERTAPAFTPREVEQAQREVLPYRQSGVVFHWADDSPNVYVTRSMWEALPEETRGKLGRAIAVAKNREEIDVIDETLAVKLAICTARRGCRRPER